MENQKHHKSLWGFPKKFPKCPPMRELVAHLYQQLLCSADSATHILKTGSANDEDACAWCTVAQKKSQN